MLDVLSEEECELERKALEGVARLVCLRASCNDEIDFKMLDQIPIAGIFAWHHCKLTDDLIAKLCRNRCLRIIQRIGAGLDNVDLEAAASHSVCVSNTPDYGIDEVADHAWWLLLSINRQAFDLSLAVRTGTGWPTYGSRSPAPRLQTLRLGIVGLGRIGTAFAMRARAFALREVAFFDPYLPRGVEKSLQLRRCESLEELLRSVDIVSIHTPLTPETRHMINHQTLAYLPRGSFLVNSARGGIVDTDAVLDALHSGQLAGSGLDVLDCEPTRADATLDARLRTVRNLVISPHIAFSSDHSRVEMRQKAADEVRRVLLGQPPRYCCNDAQLRKHSQNVKR